MASSAQKLIDLLRLMGSREEVPTLVRRTARTIFALDKKLFERAAAIPDELADAALMALARAMMGLRSDDERTATDVFDTLQRELDELGAPTPPPGD